MQYNELKEHIKQAMKAHDKVRLKKDDHCFTVVVLFA